MLANPYQRYRQVTVETASVAELVVLLYRRAVQLLEESEEAIAIADVPRARALGAHTGDRVGAHGKRELRGWRTCPPALVDL